MKRSLLNRTRGLVNAALAPVGLRVVRTSADPSSFEDEFIKAFATQLDFLIDVGAHRGAFANKFFSHQPTARALLVEPNPRLAAGLTREFLGNTGVAVASVALDNRHGRSTLNIAGNGGLSSSLLPMGQRHLDASPDSGYTETSLVETYTLDQIAGPLHFSRALLKLDVQGAEMRVLEGASETLERVWAVLVEVSLVSLYEGDCLLEEVLGFLRGAGFTPFLLDPWFRDRKSMGELIQADLMMIRPELGQAAAISNQRGETS